MMFSVFIIPFFFSMAAEPNTPPAVSLPAAEDINNLSVQAREASEEFFRLSHLIRQEYEFAGRFFGDGRRETMHRLAVKAHDTLAEIEDKQRNFKQAIEDYEGDDWEEKFGSTGLWRKLSGDIYFTSVSACQSSIDAAVSSDNADEKNGILKRTLSKIESMEQTGNGEPNRAGGEQVQGENKRALSFLKAKVLGTLAKDDVLYRPGARKEFEFAIGEEKTDPPAAGSDYRVSIEKIKFLGEDRPGQLETVTKQFSTGPCRDNLELVLSLISVQYRLGRKEAFEKTVRSNRQAEEIVASLLLGCLVSEETDEKVFKNTSIFEAELAAHKTLKEEVEKYKTLLLKLAGEKKFQTALVFYAAGQAAALTEPNRAVDYFIQSSRLQNEKKSEGLEVDAKMIAGQAAQFALDCFGKKLVDCGAVSRACENYRSIAGGQTEPQTEYLYAAVLNDCSESEKSDKMLVDLAKKNAGFWSVRAKLDLIEKKIKAENIQNQSVPKSALSELNDFISATSAGGGADKSDTVGQDDWKKRIRCEAAALYCRLLLESATQTADKTEGETSLEKVVDIVDSNIAEYEPNLCAYKAAALQRLGRLDEAARCLLSVFRENHCEHTEQAIMLLSEVVEKIDELNESAAGGKDFARLAENCCNCPQSANSRQAKLFMAETGVFAAEKDAGKLERIEKLLNSIEPNEGVLDIDFIRCRGRLFAEQGKYERAAQAWSEVCKAEETKQSEHWWRAKYYELYCWSQRRQTDKADLAHTIEVLEKTYEQVPAFWAEKLKILKKQ
jgi:hypothetical protein